MKRPIVILVLGVLASLAQPTGCTGSDLRLQAMGSLIDEERSFLGDPGPSIVAAQRLRVDRHAPLYAQDLSVGSSFIYPPIAAAAYLPVANLRPVEARATLSLVSRALFAVIVALAIRLARRVDALEILAIVGASIWFFPLVHAVQLNQATLAITALIGGAFLALAGGRQALAGALFGLCFAIKPQLVLALPLLWFSHEGARRFVLSAAATGVALFGASVALAGVDNHVVYATRVLPALSGGYAYFANQSFNGFFQRLFVATDLGIFRMPPPSVPVKVLTAVTGLVVYGVALRTLRRRRDLEPVTAFGFAWLVATMISPIAWQHHFAPALFLFVWLARQKVDELLVLSFVLMAGYFEVRGLRGALASISVSYVLLGAMLLAWRTSVAPES